MEVICRSWLFYKINIQVLAFLNSCDHCHSNLHKHKIKNCTLEGIYDTLYWITCLNKRHFNEISLAKPNILLHECAGERRFCRHKI